MWVSFHQKSNVSVRKLQKLRDFWLQNKSTSNAVKLIKNSCSVLMLHCINYNINAQNLNTDVSVWLYLLASFRRFIDWWVLSSVKQIRSKGLRLVKSNANPNYADTCFALVSEKEAPSGDWVGQKWEKGNSPLKDASWKWLFQHCQSKTLRDSCSNLKAA